LKKECHIKELLNKQFKKLWKNEQKVSKLKLDEDLMVLKLQEKKLLKKEIFLLKQLDLILITLLLELKLYTELLD
jgi:hypothetical protein